MPFELTRPDFMATLEQLSKIIAEKKNYAERSGSRYALREARRLAQVYFELKEHIDTIDKNIAALSANLTALRQSHEELLSQDRELLQQTLKKLTDE